MLNADCSKVVCIFYLRHRRHGCSWHRLRGINVVVGRRLSQMVYIYMFAPFHHGCIGESFGCIYEVSFVLVYADYCALYHHEIGIVFSIQSDAGSEL